MSTRKRLTAKRDQEIANRRGKSRLNEAVKAVAKKTGAKVLHVTKKTIKATKAGKPTKVTVVKSSLVAPPTIDDAGFLGQADPQLLQAMLETAEAELAFREGILKQREVLEEPRPLSDEEWLRRSAAHVQRWRYQRLAELTENPELIEQVYGLDPIKFICHWLDIYEPRNAGKGDTKLTRMPFILFKRQEELIKFFHACVVEEGPGLVEKSRDMGATWCGVGYSVWMWRFVVGSAIGWGSATSDKLDRLGEAGSIFEKMRLAIRGLPKIFLPKKFSDDDHLLHKRIINADNGNVISGDIGDNIGRGGRTRLYFVDEAAYIERADAVEAALSENTRVRIDISSVSGPGTVFHRSREAGVEWSPGKPISRVKHNVFIMDWSDHPEKTAQWNAERKENMESRGLGHVYAREIGRNYAATIEGSIIKPEWIEASYDAHKKLEMVEQFKKGTRYAGLDVGDETGDANAFTLREHRVLIRLQQWKNRDTGQTARHSVNEIAPFLPVHWFYDCIGIGAGVKSECNRLKEEGLLPPGLKISPWNAGAPVLDPLEHIIPGDINTPKNKDYFANLKAQAWWNLRQCFYNIWLVIDQKVPVTNFQVSQLIAIETEHIERTLLHKFRDELSQAATKLTGKMKTGVDKMPDGVPSPNMADSAVICYWPVPDADPLGAMVGGGLFVAPIVVHA